MSRFATIFWIVPAGCLLLAPMWAGGCETDGVTPVCSPDGSDCVTPPGDAYPSSTPSSDAGTE
jgi:hypothetical protein